MEASDAGKRTNGEIRTFINTMNKFLGRMELFEQNTNLWQRDTNVRLTNIESEMKAPKVCGAHSSIIAMVANQKDVENRQQEVNTSQTQTNVEVNDEQKAQNRDIGQLQESDRVIIARLPARDLVKIAALVTAISTPIVAIITVIIGAMYR